VRARVLMEHGQALFAQGQFGGAAEAFEQAYAAQPFSAFLYNAAVSRERNSQYSEAADYFARYIDREPSASDAGAVRRRIDRLRTQALHGGQAQGGGPDAGVPPSADGGTASGGGTGGTGATGTGAGASESSAFKSLLSVETNPPGAGITLRRGEQLAGQGASPYVQTLDEGTYELTIRDPAYRTLTKRVTIRPGVVYHVIVELSQGEFLGYLHVTSSEPGARVFIDDRSAGSEGVTPLRAVVPTGHHHIWIDRPGFTVVERDVEVELGEQVEVQAALARVSYGLLRVVANVRPATVTVDGRHVGSVPFEGHVAAGTHRVTIASEGMKDWEGMIEIRQGQVTPIRVRLRHAMSRSGAWITGGFTVLFLAAALTTGLMSHNIESDLEAERDAGVLASNDPRLLDGEILAITADISLGVGALLGALALYYMLRDPLPESEATVLVPRDWALAPDVDRHRAGATLRWMF